jgi:23S rRNA (cytosine1962-C5)-methyltransferase
MRPVPPSTRVDLLTDELSPGPWVFGRQVAPSSSEPEAGALVEVCDRSGRFVGHGLFNPSSDIRVRFLSRGRKTDLQRPREFLQRKLASADRIRRKLLSLPEVTNAYRIVHAEGDDLSGLMVDRLGDALVCEHHALGFWRLRADVEWALGQLYPGLPVVHRVPKSARKLESFEPEEEPVNLGDVILTEHGVDFVVSPGHGHKTGWFCDQRDNRQLVAGLARGHDVLDLCCNAGGFALHAKRAGARHVHAVDLDEEVLAFAEKSAKRGGLDVTFEHADAFDAMRRIRAGNRRPGVVVLDPHKLIAGKQRMEEGQRKYLDMNALALACTAPGGVLATFSCSGSLDLAGFLGIVFQAARRAERTIRILSTLGAAPDHPQRPDFSRSRYLKGALLAVD